MMVIRLAVLLVLGCIAWLLLRGIIGRNRDETPRRTTAGTGEHDPRVQDVLVEDPVCHTLVPKNQAIRLRRDGITYYFCSDACCDKFAGTAKGEK